MKSMVRMLPVVLSLFVASPLLGQNYDDGGGYSSGNNMAGSGIRGSRFRGGSDNNQSNSGSGDRFSRNRSSGSRFSNQSTDIESNRARNSRDTQRNRNSNVRGNEKQPAGSATEPGKKVSTTKGKEPPKKTTGSSGGEARAVTNVEFKMQADPTTNILYVESVTQPPTMNILSQQGKTFGSRVVFRNGRNQKFEHVEIALKYDPYVIQPLGVDDADLRGLLSSEPTANVDARRGILTYKAQFAQARTEEIMTLFKIKWKALESSSHSSLTFVNNETYSTRILRGDGVNVLQFRGEDDEIEVSDTAGLVDASVAIVPSGAVAEAMEDFDSGLTAIQLANNISAGTAEGGVYLSLRPRQHAVAVGEEFLVDVLYSNPKRAELDTVKLRVRFNPNAVQVVDYDENNWIAKGLNIYDGDLHDDLPFDFHMKNMAHNATGTIEYQMGFSSRVRIPASGRLATIKFKAVAPIESTEVAFEISDEEKEAKTAISFLGFNLIGTPGARTGFVQNALVSIN